MHFDAPAAGLQRRPGASSVTGRTVRSLLGTRLTRTRAGVTGTRRDDAASPGALTAAGYTTLVTGDPRQVPDLLQAEKPHLVLLDLMLSESDGLELLRRVPGLADLPVIVISVYRRGETIARAFEMGAADYIVKPFTVTEPTARVRAALRRRMGSEPFVLGDLVIDYEQRTATVGGRQVELTATEYDVLRLLSANAGRVLTYETLLRRVWAAFFNPECSRAAARWKPAPNPPAAKPLIGHQRRDGRPRCAAPACDSDNGLLSRPESHCARPVAARERPAFTAPIARIGKCARPAIALPVVPGAAAAKPVVLRRNGCSSVTPTARGRSRQIIPSRRGAGLAVPATHRPRWAGAGYREGVWAERSRPGLKRSIWRRANQLGEAPGG